MTLVMVWTTGLCQSCIVIFNFSRTLFVTVMSTARSHKAGASSAIKSASGFHFLAEPSPLSLSSRSAIVQAYERISSEVRTGTTDKECLDVTVFAINCTVRSKRLCAALLVFGGLSWPSRTTPAPSHLERALLIKFAMQTVEKRKAGRYPPFKVANRRSERSRVVADTLPTTSWCPMLVYYSHSKV